MPQKTCKGWLLHVRAYARKSWNAPKSNQFIFGPFPISKPITWFLNHMRKRVISRFSNIKKLDISRKNTWSILKWENLLFGVFQGKYFWATENLKIPGIQPSHCCGIKICSNKVADNLIKFLLWIRSETASSLKWS